MDAAEIPWKPRKLPWKQNVKFRGCSFQLFVEAASKAVRESFSWKPPSFRLSVGAAACFDGTET